MKWSILRKPRKPKETGPEPGEHEEQKTLSRAEEKLIEIRKRLEVLENEGLLITRPRWLELRKR
jgi:hypothetical protein